jgi:signal transduction histidine kinase
MESMSTQLKHYQNNNYYQVNSQTTAEVTEKKVNLNDLMEKLNAEKKREKKSNMLFSVAALSALAVFGIILTL